MDSQSAAFCPGRSNGEGLGGNGLEIKRACSVAEGRKILDAADLLLRVGDESKD